MKRKVATLALLLIAAMTLMGQDGWDSRIVVQGNHMVGGDWLFPVGADSSRMFYIPAPGMGPQEISSEFTLFDSTDASESGQVRWATFSTNSLCTLEVFTRDACSGALLVTVGTQAFADGFLTFPPMKSGIDSVRVGVSSPVLAVRISLWGMR
jgi:hypothetical protein